MTDDLVKRLRDTPNWKRETFGDYKSATSIYDRAPFESADCIRELEAKLAKAVEALHNVVVEYNLFRKDEYERGLSPLDDEIHDARTTLAELKGETDG